MSHVFQRFFYFYHIFYVIDVLNYHLNVFVYIYDLVH